MAPAPTTTPAATQQLFDNGKQDTNKQKPSEPTAIQAISQGAVTLAGIPTFTSVDKQRRWMLEHMAGAFRIFARKGYTEGMAGHISLRDPEHPDCFWTNPIGRHFGLLTVSDFILLNERGEPVGGNAAQPANAAGFTIHGHIHRRYPHVVAACHAHSVNGRAWSSFGRRLEMLNQDVCNFFGEAHGVYDECGGLVLDDAEGRRLAEALGERGKGLILRNHGLLTVGSTVDEAAYLFTLLERSCEAQLKADAAAAGGGWKKVLIPDDVAAWTFKMTSDPESLYCEFQPDYQYELHVTKGEFLE
ncbi:hypothetical protein SLS58_007965 [Diplodia intermedia]|uniref:Class II aldolase/adducin N-terminal domain-containing protein n=1 Tax=Diplodia intermedia TaxID=856260 RepID=A0ABR3TIK2_9PEZI